MLEGSEEGRLIQMMQLEIDFLALYIYSFGTVLWLYLWHKMVGYKLIQGKKLLYIAFIGPIVNFILNIILACYAKIPDYETELDIYLYVEKNATTIAGLALAISIFVVLKFNQDIQLITKPSTKMFLLLNFWAFLYAVIGCLPLYWMPPVQGALTVLRHIKTVPYTYSLFTLAGAIMIFVYQIKEGNK